MKILLVIITAIARQRVVLAECAGAAIIAMAVGCATIPAAGWGVVGVAVLAKSFEWDITPPGGDGG